MSNSPFSFKTSTAEALASIVLVETRKFINEIFQRDTFHGSRQIVNNLESYAIRESQSRRWRLVRFVPGVGASNLQLAFVDPVAAGNVKRIEMFPTESKVGRPAVRRGNNALHPAGLIADLYPHRRSDVKASIAIHSNSVCVAAVGSVRHVQPVVALFQIKRSVRLDEVTVDPVRSVVGDVEQCLVRRERDAVGILDTCVDDSLFAI